MLEKKINEDIKDLTDMDFDRSLIIFKHYAFSQENFGQNFFTESQKLTEKYGLNLGEVKFL